MVYDKEKLENVMTMTPIFNKDNGLQGRTGEHQAVKRLYTIRVSVVFLTFCTAQTSV
jgi:hypothetical protein